MRRKVIFKKTASLFLICLFLFEQILFGLMPVSLFAQEEKKTQTIDDILKELRGEKTAETSTSESFSEKKILAVMGFENLSKTSDEMISKKALDSMTEALLKTERFTLVEREKIGLVFVELELQQSDFFKIENTKKIGQFLGADLIAVGGVKSVTYLGNAKKPSGALIELSLRIIEVETTKLVFSLSAVGKSEGQGSSDYHVNQAIQRASYFICQKLPGDVVEYKNGLVEINFGQQQGIKKDQQLDVYRQGKEIGKVTVKTLRQKSFSGAFIPSVKGIIPKEGDQVFNPTIKDDTPPKKSKGGMSTTTMLLGVLVLGALAGLAGGGGKGGDSGGGTQTPAAPIVPPGPPE